jgi:hypothetical protein
MALLQPMMRGAGPAALVLALSLAGLGTAQAARSNASETDHVNGRPCNDLCKAYMAWSDRLMARPLPSRPQMRVIIVSKRPDRTVPRAPGTRRSGSNSFAQLPQPSDAAPQSVETAHMQAAPSEPVQPITERSFPADGIVTAPPDGIVTAKPADAGGATNAAPETTFVSVTGFVSATQDTGMISHVARGLDGRFGVELGLALCALLSLLSWGWLRRKTADCEHDPAGDFFQSWSSSASSLRSPSPSRRWSAGLR